MNVLVVGSGGREHAIAWAAARSADVNQVFVAPGNGGTALEPRLQNIDVIADDIDALVAFAKDNDVALTIVGPEAPLVAGIADRFADAGLACFGPRAAAAQLEGSKAFMKDFLSRNGIPTASYENFTELEPALACVERFGAPVVIKADGLAAGKGVIVAQSLDEARQAVTDMLGGNAFGEAGHRVVVEEFLAGEEASFIAMVDGKHILPFASSQDHKARDNGDQGPNTGGMGAYSPAPVVTPEVHDRIMDQIMRPTVEALAADGTPYVGFLYAGVMISPEGDIRVLEFNCRLGDPETQPLLFRLRSDLVELCRNAVSGTLDTCEAKWDERTSLGVVLAANGYPGSYPKGDTIDGIRDEEEAAKVFHAGTTLDDAGQLRSAGGRVLCAVALGASVGEAQKRAYELANEIRWDNAYFRTDIGYRAIARES